MKKRMLTLNEDSNEGSVNLTPLIDVVFVVLIMFILIAPLLELDKINLATKGHAKKEQIALKMENAPLKIRVYSDNSIWINNAPVANDDLFSYLKEANRKMPSATPQLFHDREACFGTYQLIKNSVEAAGFEEMDVILK